MSNKPVDPREGILHHNKGVELMLPSIELSGLEMRMVNAMSRKFAIRTYLEEVKPDYDAIIPDAGVSGRCSYHRAVGRSCMVIP